MQVRQFRVGILEYAMAGECDGQDLSARARDIVEFTRRIEPSLFRI